MTCLLAPYTVDLRLYQFYERRKAMNTEVGTMVFGAYITFALLTYILTGALWALIFVVLFLLCLLGCRRG